MSAHGSAVLSATAVAAIVLAGCGGIDPGTLVSVTVGSVTTTDQACDGSQQNVTCWQINLTVTSEATDRRIVVHLTDWRGRSADEQDLGPPESIEGPGSIEPGGSASFQILFEIPEDAKLEEMRYEPVDEDGRQVGYDQAIAVPDPSDGTDAS